MILQTKTGCFSLFNVQAAVAVVRDALTRKECHWLRPFENIHSILYWTGLPCVRNTKKVFCVSLENFLNAVDVNYVPSLYLTCFVIESHMKLYMYVFDHWEKTWKKTLANMGKTCRLHTERARADQELNLGPSHRFIAVTPLCILLIVCISKLETINNHNLMYSANKPENGIDLLT